MNAIKNPFHLEKDWLLSLVWLDDKNDHEMRRRVGAELGTLLGFANATEVRMMAEIGEEGDDSAVYQCLFSFPSQAARRLFLHLVRNNELTNHEVEGEEQFVVPDQLVIDDAQPLGQVLPPDIAETAARHATMVLFTLEGEDESSKVN